MLNHKTIFKQKSKILLTIICIFGLAFSYSCSCRSGGDPTRVSGGAASGNYLLIVNSAGNDYNQMATISFANATATLKTVSDADGGSSGLTESDFVYDGKNLSLKAGTTDKFDAETLKKVTTARQTVVATFSLTANSGNVDLDATEKTIKIEVVKATKIDVQNDITKIMKPESTDVQVQAGSHTFMLKLGTWNPNTFTTELKDTDGDKETSGKDLTVGYVKGDIETKWTQHVPEYVKYCDGVEWTDAQGMETQVLALYFKFKFKAEIEIDNPDQVYIIKLPMGGTGVWKN